MILRALPKCLFWNRGRFGGLESARMEGNAMKRGNAIDRAGLRYGRLTVVERAGKASDGHLLWKCRCDCGTECLVQSNNFRSGAQKGTQSCGCLRADKSSVTRRPWNAGKTYQNHGDERVYKNRKAWSAAVLRVNGNQCERCGWDRARCDVHHKVPRAQGGTNTIGNGEVICPNCHRIEHEGLVP